MKFLILLLPVLAFSFSDFEKTNNTVGLWHFDGVGFSDSIVTDYSEFKNHGIATVPTKWYSDGLLFQDTSDYVQTKNKSLFIDTNFTFESWFKIKSFDKERNWSIVSTGNPNTNWGFWTGVSRADGTYKFGIRTSNQGIASNYGISTSVTPSVDEWIHVAAVREFPMMKLYINGQEVGNTYVTGVMATNLVISFGGFYRNSKYGFDGMISEARISNIALSKSEIRDNLQKPASVSPRMQISRIDFNEPMKIYDIRGRLINQKLNKLRSGIYIIKSKGFNKRISILK